MLYLLLTIVIVLVDQVTKYLVRGALIPGESIPVIGDFLKITLVYNDGAAFGMFSGERKMLLLIPIIIIAVVLIIIAKNRDIHPLAKFALTMIAAGGIGNLIDRAVFQTVTDMISFSIFPPVFNVADIAVTVGCFLVIIYAFFGERLKKPRRR